MIRLGYLRQSQGTNFRLVACGKHSHSHPHLKGDLHRKRVPAGNQSRAHGHRFCDCDLQVVLRLTAKAIICCACIILLVDKCCELAANIDMRRSTGCSSHVRTATTKCCGRWTADSGTSWATVAAAILLLTVYTLGLAAASTSDKSDTSAQRNGAPSSIGCSNSACTSYYLDISSRFSSRFITRMDGRSCNMCASCLLA